MLDRERNMPSNTHSATQTVSPLPASMDSGERRAFYARILLEAAPRLLSRMDREPFSPTYGCLDRNYWCWKFVDFPCGRAQEGVLPLTVLFLADFPENPYHGNPRLLEWIRAGISCWARIQSPNGSHDEAYPGECSFVATGFSLFCVGEALLLLREAGQLSLWPEIRTALGKAVAFLARTEEDHAFISNHRSGCAAGLLNAWLLTDDAEALRAARRLIDSVLARQSPEGWFSEYDGFDPGYETQGLYYLSRCRKRHEFSGLDRAMGNSLDFLRYFIQPDATIGGEYARRQTTFLFPAGLEHLARTCPTAERACQILAGAACSGIIPFPASLDAYNAIPVLGSVALSLLEPAQSARAEPLPWETPGEFSLSFPLAGVELRKTIVYYAILSLRKGAALNAYGYDGQVLADHGYVLWRGNKLFSSAWWQHGPPLTGTTLKRRFAAVNRRLLDPLGLLALRAPRFLPASRHLARWMKKLLVHLLITRNTVIDAELEREVRFEADRIVVTDRVQNLRSGDRLLHFPRFTTYHMGSAKYFSSHELTRPDSGTELPAPDTAGSVNRSQTHVFQLQELP